MTKDFILNGASGGGLIANRLMKAGFDPDCLRPYEDEETGRSYITRNVLRGGKMVPVAVPLTNTTATLRRDEWKLFDEVLLAVQTRFLTAVNDLRDNGCVMTIPNGMGHTVVQSQTISDTTPATISMDGRRKGDRDRPVYDTVNFPLPIIHKDFSFSSRELEVSRNRGVPLDLSNIDLATVKVLEECEDMALGVADTYTYGGGTIYGYMNFPGRLAYVLTAPTAGGWAPTTLVNQIIAMKQLSVDHFHRGPWVLYLGSGWGSYLDEDYSAAKGDKTLRERLQAIEKIKRVSTSESMVGTNRYSALLVQMTPNVAQVMDGLPLTIVQWEEEGGFDLLWKILTIQPVRLRTDQIGNTGLVHGATA